MPNLTIKDVPRELHRRLKDEAERHRRSMNSEVICILERALLPSRRDAGAVIKKAEALNRRVDADFDEDLIDRDERREDLT